jgi:tetratricopeptide (TPR) repeat protein
MNKRITELEALIEGLGDTSSSSSVDLQTELAWELRYRDTERSLEIAAEALEASVRLGHDRGCARSLLALGMGNVILTRMSRGVELLDEARELFDRIGDLAGLASAATALGVAEEHLGNLDRARDWYTLGLDIREAIGDEQGLPYSLNNLGAIKMRLGDLPAALELFYRALPYAEAIGGMIHGVVNINIADVFNRSGEPDLALEHSLSALGVLRACGAKALEGQALVGAGCVYRNRGDLERASRFFDDALVAVRAAGSRELEAETLGEIGQLLRELGDFEGALRTSSESVEIAVETGVRFVEVESLINVGETHEVMGDAAAAVETLDRALALGVELGFGGLVYRAHEALARNHEREGRLREALDHYKAFTEGRNGVLGEESARKVKALLVKQQIELSRRESEALRIKNEALDRALSEVKQLQGLLPICCYCKSIRDDGNYWRKIESYLSERTDAVFSHGICPTCYDHHVQPALDEHGRETATYDD